MNGKTEALKRASEKGTYDRFTAEQDNSPAGRVENPASGLSFLQGKIGNQAVRRLFQSGVVQAKFKIGAPDDIYEQEADRVAEQVMRMPDTAISGQRSAFSRGNESIQTKPG